MITASDMPLINERLDPHISGDRVQPSIDGQQIASLLPEWKSLLLWKFVNWLFVNEGISGLYITGGTKITKIFETEVLCLRNRESSWDEAWLHFWDLSWLFYEFIQGLAYFLISVVIHDLSVGERANIGWYGCEPCDRRGRIACLGVRQKNVFELNPESWLRFRNVGRSEETDWQFHFDIRTNYGVNHSRNELGLPFRCPCPIPLFWLRGSSF